MNKGTTLFATLLVFLITSAAPTLAQETTISVGPRIGLDIAGDIEELFIGAEGRINMSSLPVDINPVFDFYLTDDNVSFFQLSGNALYEFEADNQSFTPYAGAGLSINRFSIDVDSPFVDDVSSTDIGVNLLGGAFFQVGSLRPYAQAQVTLSDADVFTIGGGLLFDI